MDWMCRKLIQLILLVWGQGVESATDCNQNRVSYNGDKYLFGKTMIVMMCNRLMGLQYNCTYAKMEGDLLQDRPGNTVVQWMKKNGKDKCFATGLEKHGSEWRWQDDNRVDETTRALTTGEAGHAQLEAESPQRRFAMLERIGGRSIKTLSELRWDFPSPSLVFCSSLCLERWDGCDVIRFDNRRNQCTCMGYTLGEGLREENLPVGQRAVFWKVNCCVYG